MLGPFRAFLEGEHYEDILSAVSKSKSSTFKTSIKDLYVVSTDDETILWYSQESRIVIYKGCGNMVIPIRIAEKCYCIYMRQEFSLNLDIFECVKNNIHFSHIDNKIDHLYINNQLATEIEVMFWSLRLNFESIVSNKYIVNYMSKIREFKLPLSKEEYLCSVYIYPGNYEFVVIENNPYPTQDTRSELVKYIPLIYKILRSKGSVCIPGLLAEHCLSNIKSFLAVVKRNDSGVYEQT